MEAAAFLRLLAEWHQAVRRRAEGRQRGEGGDTRTRSSQAVQRGRTARALARVPPLFPRGDVARSASSRTAGLLRLAARWSGGCCGVRPPPPHGERVADGRLAPGVIRHERSKATKSARVARRTVAPHSAPLSSHLMHHASRTLSFARKRLTSPAAVSENESVRARDKLRRPRTAMLATLAFGATAIVVYLQLGGPASYHEPALYVGVETTEALAGFAAAYLLFFRFRRKARASTCSSSPSASPSSQRRTSSTERFPLRSATRRTFSRRGCSRRVRCLARSSSSWPHSLRGARSCGRGTGRGSCRSTRSWDSRWSRRRCSAFRRCSRSMSGSRAPTKPPWCSSSCSSRCSRSRRSRTCAAPRRTRILS